MWTNYSDFYTLDPLPDELFFSTVGRTARLLNQGHFGEINLHFFNHHHKSPTTVIPVNNFKNPIEVFNHCVGPYYMASFTLKRQKVLINNIFNFKNSKFYGIFKIGTKHSSFTKKDLFFCPSCLKADLEKYGWPYFHLSHQYEGVYACPIHGVKLLGYGFNGYQSFPLLGLDNYRDPQEAQDRDILYSKWALDFKNFSHEYLSTIYRSKILERDFNLLNKQKFYKQLEEYFGYDFLYQCDCSKDQTSYSNPKILGLLNPKSRSVHPYYHYMMWEFLDLTPENFTDSIFALEGRKLLPMAQPADLSDFKLIEEDLGKKIYFSENMKKNVVEFFPIDIRKFIKLI